MAWGKAGSDTLTSASSSMDSGTMTASKTNQILIHWDNSGSISSSDFRLNDVSSNSYAHRNSTDGGADSTSVSQNGIDLHRNDIPAFSVLYMVDISGEEKLLIESNIHATTGAGNAPSRVELVGKYAVTTSRITQLTNTANSNNWAVGSNLSVLGSDLTPASAVTFPTNAQVGSRAEITDSRKMYNFTDPLIADDDFTSYTDQTAFDNSWVTSNTAKFRGNPTNDNIDILNSNAYDNIYYDLGSVSDTKWLCRFKVTLTTAGSQSLGFCYFYVGSTTGDANESNDGLGFYFYDNANNTYTLADNGNRPDQTTVTGALGINPSTTTYYAEMKRTSATSFTVTLYSDSSYSTSLGTSTLTISSGITGLRYFKIMGYTTSGGLVGTFDDFKFYNNSTETSNYWQEIGA